MDARHALVELLRGRTAILGPSTAAAFGRPFGLAADEAERALLALESDGVVLRGAFTPAPEASNGATAGCWRASTGSR